MFRKFILYLNGFMWAGLFLPLSEDESNGVISQDKYDAWKEYIKNRRISPLFETEPDASRRCIDLQGCYIDGKRDIYRQYYEQSRLEHYKISPQNIEPCDLEGARCWPIVHGLNYKLNEGRAAERTLPNGEYFLKFGPDCYCANLCVLANKNQIRGVIIWGQTI